MQYLNGAIVRVKQYGNERPFLYAQIKEVYIYKGHKVFLTTTTEVVLYKEHLRATKVVVTQEPLIFHSTSLYCNGVLHLKHHGHSTCIHSEARLLFINTSDNCILQHCTCKISYFCNCGQTRSLLKRTRWQINHTNL